MSRALLKFVRVSPTKARLIAREVQGMNAELALASLEFMPNKAAGIISKVIVIKPTAHILVEVGPAKKDGEDA